MPTPPLVYFSAASILVPALLALWQWSKLNELEKSLARLIFVITVIQGVALLLAEVLKLNNMPLYHFYLVLEFNLLFNLFYYHIFRFKEQRAWVLVLALSVIVFVVNGIWVEHLTRFPSYLRALGCLLSSVLAIVFFVNKLSRVEAVPLKSDPAFWMSCGIFIYYTTNMLLFFYIRMFDDQPELFNYIWVVHSYLNILLYTFYAIALVCRKKP